MSSAMDMERARTAMMVAAGLLGTTGLFVLTQRSIRSSIAYALKVRRRDVPPRVSSLGSPGRARASSKASCFVAPFFTLCVHRSSYQPVSLRIWAK